MPQVIKNYLRVGGDDSYLRGRREKIPGAYWRAALIREVLIKGRRLLEGGAN